jgi:hypothetical protein
MGAFARFARMAASLSIALAIACAAPASNAGFGVPRFDPP